MLPFYVAVARTAFRRQLIYRWANVAGLATNAFFAAILSYVVIALYQVRHSAGGYGLADALRYIWLVQAMIMPVLPFGWFDLMLTIRTGEVVTDIGKPCDFYWYWFSREVGRDLYYVLFRGLPTYLLGMLLFGFGAPDAPGQWLLYAGSLAVGSRPGHRLPLPVQYRRLLDRGGPCGRRHGGAGRPVLYGHHRAAGLFSAVAARHRRLAAVQRLDERARGGLPGQGHGRRAGLRAGTASGLGRPADAGRAGYHGRCHPAGGRAGRVARALL